MIQRPRGLSAVVFAAGAASLAVEICASRLLAPYFGNSTIVWANVIGLILVYLSVGYWLGGRIADRHPTPRGLGMVLVAAAITTAVLPFVAHPFLDLALHGFAALSVGAVAGSFVATLLLFAVPVSLLGMASPYALRLALSDVSRAGVTSGRLSSVATLGAIAGTFAAALLLIPSIGTQRTLLCAALLAAVVSLPLWTRAAAVVAIVVAALIALPPAPVKPVAGTILEEQTQYQFIQVIKEADGKTVLRTDEGVADQSVYRAETPLTGGEWDMASVVPPLLSTHTRRVLVIGNATGTTARLLAALYPGIHIDGVELDSEITHLGSEYFGESTIPGLDVITADGRAFLDTTSQRYDLIVVDAYRQTYIPFYLTTEEFFGLVQSHLNPGGAVALNVERVPGDERLVQAVSGTLASVMRQVIVWPALRFNELVVGMSAQLSHAELQLRLQQLPSRVAVLGPLVAASEYPVAPSGDALTDDHAPVEWLTDRAVLTYIAEGGRLNEHLLPTAP